MKRDKDGYTLSTGRHFYANNGILGMDESLFVSQGYDGGVGQDEWNARGPFTLVEREEIAKFMVELWTSWAYTETKESQS